MMRADALPVVLPIELMDRVIYHLHDDQKTLSACALVCSNWLPAVRSHRFRHVRVWPRTLAAFHTLLQASPDLPLYVANLRISCDWSTVQDMAALHDILSSLPNIPALSLSLRRSVVDTDKIHLLFSIIPKSLRSFHLEAITLPTVGDLIFLWIQLPHLRSFALRGPVDIRNAEIPQEYMRGDKGIFRATELLISWEVPHFDAIVDWLCLQNVPAQLRACSLTVTKVEHISPAGKLLREVGPALESLEFHLYNGEKEVVMGRDVLDSCDLGQCTGLQKLQLSGSIWDNGGDGDIFLRMCRILSQIRAPGIRVLVISLGIIFNPNSIGRTVAQLGTVAAAVSKAGAFADLEQVVVDLYDLLDVPISEDVYVSVRDVFKHFEERGLLTIEGA